MGDKNRATVVYQTFRDYLGSYREYLQIAERRAFELLPERKAGGFVLTAALLPYVASHAAGQQAADALVQQLSGLPAELYTGPVSVLCPPQPSPCSPPPLPPAEARRQHVENQLHGLGRGSVPALAQGLGSADVSVRRN
jgi:hypothetical protein